MAEDERWKKLTGEVEDAPAKSQEQEPLPRVGEPAGPPQEFTPIVLEKLDELLFLARKQHLWRPRGQKGIYGGQVLSQSLSACLQSVAPGKELHSMHSYFLRAGKETADIIYSVTRVRDGASFSTRFVTAKQGGKPIFVLMASFQKRTFGSLVHQDVMPKVPPPENLMDSKQFLLSQVRDPRCPPSYARMLTLRANQKSVIDVRRVVTHDLFDGTPLPEGFELPEYPIYTTERRQVMWMRTKKPLPSDENVHRAVLAYASDLGLLMTAKGTTPVHEISMVASLDHTMHFFSPFRMDEWMLYVMESPRVNNERGLSFGKIFRRDGVLAVTVSQEGVLRLESDRPKL